MTSWNVIGTLKNLKAIYIRSCGIIPSIKFLANLEKIEKIGIADTKVEDGEVAYIYENKSLQEFNLQTFKHYDVTWEQVDEFNGRNR